MTLLSVHGLTKRFGAALALDNVVLSLLPGEVHALMGENGAGKSTLIRILAGVQAADAGEVQIDGRPVTLAAPSDAERLGLRFIHQELNIVSGLSIAENLFLGRAYPRRLGLFVDWGAINSHARAALARLGIDHLDPSLPITGLSPGDQMLVKIAGAFIEGDGDAARLYVMDEPTAALTGAESERLFAVIARLKAKGAAILYVSHRMDEVMRLADRVTVLRDGRVAATLPMAETDRNGIIALMTGRSIAASEQRPSTLDPDRVALQVDDLSTLPGQTLSLRLQAGEIVGLAGLAGAGQSALLHSLMGANGPQGRLSVGGRDVSIREPADAWAAGIAYVPRERRREGLMLRRSVADNAVLPHLTSLSRMATVPDRGRIAKLVADLSARVRLKALGPGQPVGQLSGGNQQKVVFARAIAGRPSVLLLDEPTRGVDVGAKFDIHALVRDMAGEGTGVLVASSDLPELIALCDRLIIMSRGSSMREVSTAGLSEARLLEIIYEAEQAMPAAVAAKAPVYRQEGKRST